MVVKKGSCNLDNLQSETVIEQLRRAVGLARAGDRAGAEVVFGQILEKRPDNVDALVWKAALTTDAGEAVRCLEHARRIEPDNARVRAGLEWAYRRQATSNEQRATSNEPEVLSPEPTGTENKVLTDTDQSSFVNQQSTTRYALPKLTANFKVGTETKTATPAYKKRRLEEGNLPQVELPPEALPSHRATATRRKEKPREANTETQKEAKNRSRTKAKRTAANPNSASASGIYFRVAPQLRNALGVGETPRLALGWSLLAFGLAIGLAFLAFPLSILAPALGMLAVVATLVGVVLFNRARF
jgi:hypothetical protein